MLDPKEKARELVDKYTPLVKNWDCYWDVPLDDDIIISDAKKCARIAVEECLHTCVESSIYYWKEVKEEIEKL